MDLVTVALQQSRVAAFMCLQHKAVAHLIATDEEEDVVKKKRLRSMLQQRIHWNSWVSLHKNRPIFRRHMRMTHESFCRLLDMVRPHFPILDEKMGNMRGGFIIPELRLYAVIRYLAGASYTDVCFLLVCRQVHSIIASGRWSMPSTKQSKSSFRPL